METKFYHCQVCGNVIIKLVDSGQVPTCCGKPMEELVPNSTEGKVEFHLPMVVHYDRCSLKICVGKQPHPMTPEHNIRFIYIETATGGHIIQLRPGHPAEVTISTTECPKAIYAYCNLHGLWKTVIPNCPDSFVKDW